MKITLCGSIVFHNKALCVKKELEKMGHKVKLWPVSIRDGNGNPLPILCLYFYSFFGFFKDFGKAGNINKKIPRLFLTYETVLF